MWFHREIPNTLDALIVPQSGAIPLSKTLAEPDYSTSEGQPSELLNCSPPLVSLRGADQSVRPYVARSLLLIHQVTAAVLLPAGFVAFSAERLFFAIADRLDAAGVDAGCSQSVLHGTGALIA